MTNYIFKVFHFTLFSFLLLLFNVDAQNSWTRKADLPAGRRNVATGFSIGTKGYIGLGFIENAAAGVESPTYKDFWEWDQTTNVWSQKADFGGHSRALATGFSIGTKGYIGTGYDVGVAFDDFWEWDQASNIWKQKANFGGGKRL